jgi:hypothetical protein
LPGGKSKIVFIQFLNNKFIFESTTGIKAFDGSAADFDVEDVLYFLPVEDFNKRAFVEAPILEAGVNDFFEFVVLKDFHFADLPHSVG